MRTLFASTSMFIVGALLMAAPLSAQFATALTVDGDVVGDQLGASVACAGDVNGDGFDDVVVGILLADVNGTDSGRVRVYSGLTGILLYTFDGDAAGDNFGRSVDSAGDVNDDGFDDVVVGAPFHDTGGANAGRVRVFSGADGSVLYTFGGDDSNDQLGTSVSGAGDVNGDGFSDIVAGAWGDDNNGVRSGAARVYSGVDGSILYTFDGDAANDQLGYSVSGAGDTNGDGFDDVIAGIWADDNNGTNSGSARIYSGMDGSVLHMILGDSPTDEFGRSVSGAGDVNRDGFADVIIGAPQDDNVGSNSGSARVVSGFDGATLHVFNGTSASDRMGENVNSAGDVNGDGFADLIVGMPFEDNGSLNSGTVVIYSGLDGTIITQVDGPSAGSLLGKANASAGDFNGDGFDDIVIGNSFSDNNGQDTGEAKVMLAPTLPVLNYSTNEAAQHTLQMDWMPTGGNTSALTGILVISGGTPGGMGEIGISLAAADIVIFGFLPLLIAIDPVNVVSDDFFGFDANGELVLPNLSRQSPFLAGNFIFIQSFEISPIIRSSNGLRSFLVP